MCCRFVLVKRLCPLCAMWYRKLRGQPSVRRMFSLSGGVYDAINRIKFSVSVPRFLFTTSPLIPTAICSAGTYSSNGVVPCTACPFASFQSTPQSTSCTPCASGRNTTSTGSTSSLACIGVSREFPQLRIARYLSRWILIVERAVSMHPLSRRVFSRSHANNIMRCLSRRQHYCIFWIVVAPPVPM